MRKVLQSLLITNMILVAEEEDRKRISLVGYKVAGQRHMPEPSIKIDKNCLSCS